MKALTYLFLFLHLTIPLITPDLFPFSSFPMFSSKVPKCTSFIKAVNILGNPEAISILDQNWIYLANDNAKLGCKINEMSGLIIKNGENDSSSPLKEILAAIRNTEI